MDDDIKIKKAKLAISRAEKIISVIERRRARVKELMMLGAAKSGYDKTRREGWDDDLIRRDAHSAMLIATCPNNPIPSRQLYQNILIASRAKNALAVENAKKRIEKRFT